MVGSGRPFWQQRVPTVQRSAGSASRTNSVDDGSNYGVRLGDRDRPDVDDVRPEHDGFFQRVTVWLDEPRQNSGTSDVDDAGIRPHQFLDVRARADGCDPAARHGERLGAWCFLVHGHDVAVQNQISSHGQSLSVVRVRLQVCHLLGIE